MDPGTQTSATGSRLYTRPPWRFLLAIPILLWGFWYPLYIWGIGLSFDPRELLFGAYGLMGCPSTMVPLSLLFLKYPAGNRPLFYALTVFAVIIGFFMTLLHYWPDTPLFFIGLASLGLIIETRLKGRGKASTKQSFRHLVFAGPHRDPRVGLHLKGS